MKKILICTAALALATLAPTYISYASIKTDNSNVFKIENNVQPTNNWRLVKHTFQLYVPQNTNALSQLIIDTPPTVGVSNDIDVLAQNGQKININVSAIGRRIIIDFPEKVIYKTKLMIEFNKVKQPVTGPDSVYNLSAKVVGSNAEIPVGVARFHTF